MPTYDNNVLVCRPTSTSLGLKFDFKGNVEDSFIVLGWGSNPVVNYTLICEGNYIVTACYLIMMCVDSKREIVTRLQGTIGLICPSHLEQ